MKKAIALEFNFLAVGKLEKLSGCRNRAVLFC